eukprot:m.90780 g.90780  ORF g.90780 m.90780 type:complete len:345 (-) comp8477_c0_seq6:106-1140(-)
MVCFGCKFAEAVKNILLFEFMLVAIGTCLAFWILFHEYQDAFSTSSSISQAAASGPLYNFLLAISLINATFLLTFTLVFSWIEWPGKFELSSSWFISLLFRVIGILGLILLGIYTTYDNSVGCSGGIPPGNTNTTIEPCNISPTIARTHQAGALLYMLHFLFAFFSQLTAFPRKTYRFCEIKRLKQIQNRDERIQALMAEQQNGANLDDDRQKLLDALRKEATRESFDHKAQQRLLDLTALEGDGEFRLMCSVHFWNMIIGLSATISVALFLILGAQGLNVMAVLFEGIAVSLVSLLYGIHMAYILKPLDDPLLQNNPDRWNEGAAINHGTTSSCGCCTVVDFY